MNHPLHGKKLSNSHKESLSLAAKKKFQNGYIHNMLGKKHSRDSIAKMKKSHKGQVPWNKTYEKCLIFFCRNQHDSQGFCGKHRMRLVRTGSTDILPKQIQMCSILNCNLPYLAKGYCSTHYQRFNPRSYGSDYDLDLEIAMIEARKRDNNTCQWYGCNLTHREAPIHVHHIFPKSEYPELRLVIKYMICYCANHHGLWHRYRGDPYHKIIRNTRIINK